MLDLLRRGGGARELLASELFAHSQGVTLLGPCECFWCGGLCPRTWTAASHGQAPPAVVGVKGRDGARRPANPYVCFSCVVWRRPYVTVQWLGGGFKDRQSLPKCSTLITEGGVWGVRTGDGLESDRKALWATLLNPPAMFALSLISPGASNRLHLQVTNNVGDVRADTEFRYTMDGVVFTYSVYELESALRGDGNGAGGVRTLIRTLGNYKLPEREESTEKRLTRGKGRPPKDYQAVIDPPDLKHKGRYLKSG